MYLKLSKVELYLEAGSQQVETPKSVWINLFPTILTFYALMEKGNKTFCVNLMRKMMNFNKRYFVRQGKKYQRILAAKPPPFSFSSKGIHFFGELGKYGR